MFKLNRKASAFSVAFAAIAAGSAGFAPSAFAQDDSIEEVVVTGSRLTRSNVTSSVPLVQIGAQEIDSRGTTRIEDVVNILPNVFVSQTSEVANGASGTSTLNLRGLGATRTLVLIDGKRLPFGSPFSSAANVDLVPARLVERVDIVTAGASAVYGSDAVAGVVNFITKRNFEGFELDYQYGWNENPNDNGFMADVLQRNGINDPGGQTGGESGLMSFLMGVNTADNSGNITIFGSYEDQEELLGGDRDTGACTLGGSSTINCVGSSNFRRFNGTLGNGVTGTMFQQEDGTLTSFKGGAAETYNFGARNHYQRPVERWNLGASGYYEIGGGLEAYADTSYMNNNTTAQIAESASFNRAFETNCSNPLLQAGRGPSGAGAFSFADFTGNFDADGNFVSCNDILAAGGDADVQFINSHRNVEGGPRISTYENSTWRAVAGLRGDLGDDFNFDVFAQYSGTEGTRISQRDLNFKRVQQALYVTEDANGNAVCRDTSGGCVPWNIFERNADGSTAITAEQTGFIQGIGIVTGETEQLVFGGTIEGDLTNFGIKSPFADAGANGLVGFETRTDKLSRLSDDISKIAGGQGLTGTGGATLPIDGQIEVDEIFMEASIPVVTGQPWAEELGISAGYRYSDYTTTGNGLSNSFDADTWFVGASWSPTEDIRFRVNQARSIRAPNVFDLYVGINTGLTDLSTGENGLFDPCASAPGVAPAASAEGCARTGATAAQYSGGIEDNPAGQYNLITGGNPNLVAETGDTFTFGVIYTPSFIENLTVAVDYFDIEVTDAIGSIPAQASLDGCIAGGAGSETFCSLIQRDTAGTLWLSNDAPGGGLAGISQQNANITSLTTEGIDLNVTYAYDLGNLGSLNLDYAATILDASNAVPFAGADAIECLDLYAGQCGLPTPEYTHRALVNWVTPVSGLGVAMTWRHVGETTLYGLDAAAAGAREEQMNDYMEERNYLDLSANYAVTDNITIRAGANNLLAEDAPLSTNVGTGTGNNNTYPGLFDVSRFFFAGATYKF
jgi:outer membrane receptor protein involved in Fe transport